MTLGILLVPLGSAQSCEVSNHQPLDFYLSTDDQDDLILAALPPSAANQTTWSLTVDQAEWTTEASVRLRFPGPDHVISELHGPVGSVRVAAERVFPVAPVPGFLEKLLPTWDASVDVRLVEGDRYVVLATTGLTETTTNLTLMSPYPGHGEDGAPHTHGNGTDPDRPLQLRDLAVEFVFRVDARGASLGPFEAPGIPIGARFRFDVAVDGHSFLLLRSDGLAGEEHAHVVNANGGGSSYDDHDPDFDSDPESTPNLGWVAAVATLGGAAAMRRRSL